MKNILSCFLFFFCSIYSYADGVVTSSFEPDIKDLSVRTKARQGRDGKNCALVKVLFPGDGLSFEGNIIGNVSYADSEYWVYMEEGSDVLVVNCPNCDPLTIMFEEYEDVKKVDSNVTYKLTLQFDKYDYNKSYAFNSSGEHNGHSYVDLGLSVKWATCNLGAQLPNERGLRFAWGETNSKSNYTINNYKFRDFEVNSSEEHARNFFANKREYFTVVSENSIDNSDYNAWLSTYTAELTPSVDAARVNWGGVWRMPTKDEIIELYNSCTFMWTEYNGVEGYVVTGLNGNSIFLPIGDIGEKKKTVRSDSPKDRHMFFSHDDTPNYEMIKVTRYWSSTFNFFNDQGSICLELGNGIKEIALGESLYNGYLIRPVLEN